MKKNILFSLLCVLLLLFLAGCSPEPLSEDVVREELKNYFEANLNTGMMTAVGDLLEYHIEDEIERNTEKEIDTIDFTVKTVENGGLSEGHLYRDYFEPTVQEVAKYRVKYLLNDKEWELDSIEKIDVLSCMPLEGIREETFIEELEFEEKLEASLVSQDLDKENGISVIKVNIEKSYSLFKESGQKEYTFEFDNERKIWENTNTEKVGQWDYTYRFNGNDKWMYQTDTDEYGGRSYVALQLSYNTEDELLTARYAGGYVDKYDRRINKTEVFTWYGKPSPDDPLVFVSDGDSHKLKIINDGSAINFQGYSFYKVK